MTVCRQSSAIARLTPTSFEILRECPLRYSFWRQRAHAAAGTPATRLGTICHDILDRAVTHGALLTPRWRAAIEEMWADEMNVERAHSRPGESASEPESWPGYQLKRARLLHLADRLRGILSALPPDAEVLTEVELDAQEGRLHGRADLVVRSDSCHVIIDYKSGGVVDRETAMPREGYVRQLRMYAYLEHSTTGSWPSAAHLLPLEGSPVEIEIDPAGCSSLANEALDAMDSYNRLVPGPQPASPSTKNCGWCSASAVCPAFWEACDAAWQPNVLAVSGHVAQAFHTDLGGTTLLIQPIAGSLGSEVVAVKQIDPDAFEALRAVSPGDDVAATGLVRDSHGHGFRLGAFGRIALRSRQTAGGRR